MSRTTPASAPAGVVATDSTAAPHASLYRGPTYAGIGRLRAAAGLLIVNNLYRNLEVWRFAAGSDGCPDSVASRALYHDAAHPGEDDLHFADVLDGRRLVTADHYGRVLLFDLEDGARELTPAATLCFAGDTERLILARGRLIASSPRGYRTADAAMPGICVSEPLASALDAASERGQHAPLRWRQELADWGRVDALAADADGTLLAVAAAGRLGLFHLSDSDHHLRPRGPLWQAQLPFLCLWLAFDPAGEGLLAAGPCWGGAEPDSYGWDDLRGGLLQAFRLDGRKALRAAMPEWTAWGYGGQPLVLPRDGAWLYAVDRRAGLHRVSLLSGESQLLWLGQPAANESTASASLGIGHADIVGSHLYAGFSRGGYRLFHYRLPA